MGVADRRGRRALGQRLVRHLLEPESESIRPHGRLQRRHPLIRRPPCAASTAPGQLGERKARFYDPATGRFLTEDPVDGKPDNPPSLHRYLYAYANPTLYTDPDGRWPSLDDFIDVAQAAVTAVTKTQRQLVTATAKGIAKAAVGVADFASLGSVSAITKQVEPFQSTKGSVLEKLDAAGKVRQSREHTAS